MTQRPVPVGSFAWLREPWGEGLHCSEVDSLASHLTRNLAEHDITMSQFGVLEALLHLGPLSQGDICHKLLLSGSNITTVIDNLEKRALVRRDRRTDECPGSRCGRGAGSVPRTRRDHPHPAGRDDEIGRAHV